MPFLNTHALSAYNQLVSQSVFIDNSRQRFILEDLIDRINSFWPPKVPFYYLWGSVGSGKTTIINLLFEYHKGKKQRWHYSDIVHYISNEVLNEIVKPSDWKKYVKKSFKRRELLCIDEWVLEDITQVMMWRLLLPALWERGVYVVVTSNSKVENIYLNGLGREHFLPTIEMIKQNGFIYDLVDSVDYRKKDDIHFNSPFVMAKTNFLEKNVVKKISNKPIVYSEGPILFANDELLCIDFENAITPPMWRKIYLQWVSKYSYILISNVSKNIRNKNQLTNWVRLVDLLYDEGVFVFLTTDFHDENVSSELLWPERTCSRVHSWMLHQKKWAQQNLK